MPTVKEIFISPVKSLALQCASIVHVSPTGILEDRRFFIIDASGQLMTQRQIGHMVQIKAEYRLDPERLHLDFPTGNTLDGPLDLGGPVAIPFWGRQVGGRLVDGDWNAALSDFLRHPVLLVRSDYPGQSYDEFPVSLVSQASVDELVLRAKDSSISMPSDPRRFRPNLVIDGCIPNEEDSWIGKTIKIGQSLVLRMVKRDPRCAITTHDPDSGARDFDTLRLILSYRPDVKAYMGVYGIVDHPGKISLGDQVSVLSS
ncbi:MAG: MOSC domain-containing protein [SAR202 cluster bacterium]|nr:MOSC domain-containing protein [SAR202 cluster bacterium]